MMRAGWAGVLFVLLGSLLGGCAGSQTAEPGVEPLKDEEVQEPDERIGDTPSHPVTDPEETVTEPDEKAGPSPSHPETDPEEEVIDPEETKSENEDKKT